MIISFSVVGLICSNSAARFCTPPATSSARPINRASISSTIFLNGMPSGGRSKLGRSNEREVRMSSRMRSTPIVEPSSQWFGSGCGQSGSTSNMGASFPCPWTGVSRVPQPLP